VRHLCRAVLCRRLDEPGAEYCGLWRDEDGWELNGTVLLALSGRPLHVRYQVLCNTVWQTRAVNVELYMGTAKHALQVTVDDQQKWWVTGNELVPLRGCLDVDLGVTPATNTLPIRRLGLTVGSSREVIAAWVRFPDLVIEPLFRS
jgi:hypothetical protein